MSDGDKPRVGPPVIHITPSDQGSEEEVNNKPGGPTGRFGFRNTRVRPKVEGVVKREKNTLSQSGHQSRRVTVVDGRRSQLSPGEDEITALLDDDEVNSDLSGTEVEILKRADIKLLENLLSQPGAPEPLTANQIKGYVEQLYRDVSNFKKVASGVKKRLHNRQLVDDDVKTFMLDQVDKITRYCNELDSKLAKVMKAARKGYASVQLKSGANGLSFKGADINTPKRDAPEEDLIGSTDIICDGYKQLLAMSRFWKMEWPSFEILTGIAADYAGVEIEHDNMLAQELTEDNELSQDQLEEYRVMALRLHELGNLASQLQSLTKSSSDTEQPAGIRELLGTIYPDAESGLESMPMDYFYALGGRYSQKKQPMDVFETRLKRIRGEILTLGQDLEQVQKCVIQGKPKLLNRDGLSIDAASEFERIKEELEKLEARWKESFPSVQRLYTERVKKRKRRRR